MSKKPENVDKTEDLNPKGTEDQSGEAGVEIPVEVEGQTDVADPGAANPEAANHEEEPVEAQADAETPPTEEEIKNLQAAAAKTAEHWDRLVRLTAEFENFKKRANRDRLDAIKYANEALLEKLIPSLDHFEMALAAAESAQGASIDSLKTGISMVHSQLKNVLQESGLEEINAEGQSFDPSWQEAVSQLETDEVPEGQIVKQVRKGYKLKDRLLRPATVIVAKAPDGSVPPEASEKESEPIPEPAEKVSDAATAPSGES